MGMYILDTDPGWVNTRPGFSVSGFLQPDATMESVSGCGAALTTIATYLKAGNHDVEATVALNLPF